MNILMAHNRYQIRGGEDECYEEEVALLESHGHILDRYEENNHRLSNINPLKAAQKTIWSHETFDGVRRKLSTHTYDLVHIHNFLPLISPSIYYAARASGVPVVQTLHNYRLLCPNGLFFRQGKVCEDCLDKNVPWPSVLHNCYRKNCLASLTVASMLTTHRIFSTWADKVDAYIALTEFARQKFIAGGIPPEKIFVKSNFVYRDLGSGSGSGNYALYVGRLSVEKGLDILLESWSKLHYKIPLKIVGDGPLVELVNSACTQQSNIEYLGRKPLKEVCGLMGEAKFLIFPSKWYEGMPRVILEAFSRGTPVIAANLGALGELVDHGRTGLHFTSGNSEDLANQVDWALSHRDSLIQMRREVRTEFETKYTAQASYQKLMTIYEAVVQKDSLAVSSN